MMKGMTRLAMGVTLTVTLSLALLLTFLLFLLANLFCSLLLRNSKRQHDFQSNNVDDPAGADEQPQLGPLSLPFYAHGVLQVNAPTSKFLLSNIPNLKATTTTMAAKESCPSSPPGAQQRGGQITDNFVYISNPIYGGPSAAGAEANGGDEEKDGEDIDSEGWSPPLKLMKKLPSHVAVQKANSSAYEGRQSLAASTETNYRPSSSSLSSSLSSNSLCSSPAW